MSGRNDHLIQELKNYQSRGISTINMRPTLTAPGNLFQQFSCRVCSALILYITNNIKIAKMVKK